MEVMSTLGAAAAAEEVAVERVAAIAEGWRLGGSWDCSLANRFPDKELEAGGDEGASEVESAGTSGVISLSFPFPFEDGEPSSPVEARGSGAAD